MAAGEKLKLLMESQKGKPNGVASLDSAGKVPDEQMPDMNYLPTDGGTMLGALNMNNKNITSLADPVNDTDAANKEYVDKARIRHGICETSGATADKVVTMDGSGDFTLSSNTVILVRFRYGNSSTTATMNVNGTGAKSIRANNAAIKDGMILNGMEALFQYDGAYWHLLNPAADALLDSPAFTGTPKAPDSATDYATARLRNIRAGTTDLTAGSSSLNSGEIYLVYE